MVRSLIVVVVLALAGCSGESTVAAGPKPPWTTDLASATAQAAQRHQPMVLRFSAAWCGVCHDLEAEVWPQPEVQNALSKLVPVHIDTDAEAAQSLCRTYNVEILPTLVLVDAQGTVLARHEGRITPQELVAFLTPGTR